MTQGSLLITAMQELNQCRSLNPVDINVYPEPQTLSLSFLGGFGLKYTLPDFNFTDLTCKMKISLSSSLIRL